MTAKELIEQIRGATDRELIEALREGEERVTVLRAIDARLEELPVRRRRKWRKRSERSCSATTWATSTPPRR